MVISQAPAEIQIGNVIVNNVTQFLQIFVRFINIYLKLQWQANLSGHFKSYTLSLSTNYIDFKNAMLYIPHIMCMCKCCNTMVYRC